MIEVKSLVKKYCDKLAINNLCATISERGVHAILGPSGAGKTTLLDIITGYTTCDSGEVLINGADISELSQDIKKKIAYLPANLPLYDYMTAYEHLIFVGAAKRVPQEKLHKRVMSIMEIVRISDVAERTIKKLSPAQRVRLGVAQCMLGNPDVIIFDEPMAALSAEDRAELGGLIKKLGDHKCVVVSASALADVEDICDDLMILSGGEVIVHGSKSVIEEKLISTRTLTLSAKGDEEVIVSAIKSIDGISSCIITSAEAGVISMKLEYDMKSEIRGALFAVLAKLSCPILSMMEKSLTLADVYLLLVDSQKADEDEDNEEKSEIEEQPKKRFRMGGKR